MLNGNDPKWLRFLEKHAEWLGVPNIAIIFVTLQVFGFFLVSSDPLWIERLSLRPEMVLHGEVWRLVTFLSMPISMSPIWALFALLFLYSILNQIESEWGHFKTTFYTLVSIVLTVIFSLVFSYPVYSVTEFSSTLFLAAAALYPEQEVRLYMILPVKMKYLGYIALGFFALHLFQGEWLDRLFLLTIYSNYLIFFGPSLLAQVRNWKRRRDYRSKMR